MTSHANIFDHDDPWKGTVAASAMMHALLFGGVLAYGMYASRSGDSWGDRIAADGAMSATLVSSAIPLPATESPTENVLATESKGLSESIPNKAEPEPEAVPIPDKIAKTKPSKETPRPTVLKPTRVVPPASNIVPYGQGGPVSGQYTVVKTATGSGGLAFGADGSFGSRYAWYVETVRRKVSENWLKYEVDPSITSARRVYITFEIGRNGEPGNVAISQSSGVPSLDQSARRALQRIDTFGPLPNDYGGSRVAVEFWFDYKK